MAYILVNSSFGPGSRTLSTIVSAVISRLSSASSVSYSLGRISSKRPLSSSSLSVAAFTLAISPYINLRLSVMNSFSTATSLAELSLSIIEVITVSLISCDIPFIIASLDGASASFF